MARMTKDARAAYDARKQARMSAYEALARECHTLGWPTSFANDLTVHAYALLTAESAPTEYGAGVRESGVDVYAPDVVDDIELVEMRAANEPQTRWYTYTPEHGLVSVSAHALCAWLAQRLDIARYERKLTEARVKLQAESATAQMRPYDQLAQAEQMSAQAAYKRARATHDRACSVIAQYAPRFDD